MEKAKRARKAETPRQPSLALRLRAPYLYPDRIEIDEPRTATLGENLSLADVVIDAVPAQRFCLAEPATRRLRPPHHQGDAHVLAELAQELSGCLLGNVAHPLLRLLARKLLEVDEADWQLP